VANEPSQVRRRDFTGTTVATGVVFASVTVEGRFTGLVGLTEGTLTPLTMTIGGVVCSLGKQAVARRVSII